MPFLSGKVFAEEEAIETWGRLPTTPARFPGKVFAEEEAIETILQAKQIVAVLRTGKVFAEEEAIETFKTTYVLNWCDYLGKYSLRKKRLRQATTRGRRQTCNRLGKYSLRKKRLRHIEYERIRRRLVPGKVFAEEEAIETLLRMSSSALRSAAWESIR